MYVEPCLSKIEKPCTKLLLSLILITAAVFGGNIGKGLSEKLQQLQNKAARIVTLSNYETRSKDLLVELGGEVLEG